MGSRRTYAIAFLGVLAPVQIGARQQNAEDLAIPLPLHEIASFGGIEHGSDLSLIGDLQVGDDGAIYVLDAMSQRVLRFDEAGKVLATIGERGVGPGHFVHVGALYPTADGLTVFDAGQNLLHHFSSQGDFRRAERAPTVEGVNLNRVYPLAGGQRLGVVLPTYRLQPQPDGPGKVLYLDRDRAVARTLLEYAGGNPEWFEADRGLPWGLASETFGDFGAWALAGDSVVVVGDGLTGRVSWYAVAADTVLLLRSLDLEPAADTRPSDIAWMEGVTRERVGDRLPPDVGWNAPDRLSSITRLLIAQRGDVWVRRGWDRGTHSFPHWTVIPADPTAPPVTVAVPAAFKIWQIWGGRLFATSVDGFEVPIVHVLEPGEMTVRLP